MLGVYLVTDICSDVVGSISDERMGEGPGKGEAGWILQKRLVTLNIYKTERPATDSGSGIYLAIPSVDKVKVVPTGELIVGEGGG